MPESRKRNKKATEEVRPVYKNPLKKKWGRIVVIVLVFGFLLGTVIAAIIGLIQVMQTM